MAAATNPGVACQRGEGIWILMRTTVGYLEKGRTQGRTGGRMLQGAQSMGPEQGARLRPQSLASEQVQCGGPGHRCSWRLKNNKQVWPPGARGAGVIGSQADVSESLTGPGQSLQEREQDAGREMRNSLTCH